ncbi:MAG: sortase [Actinomycetota bacterium]|nr:sortase [Actinomycetota bacterium]
MSDRSPLYPEDPLGRPRPGDRDAGWFRRLGSATAMLFDSWRRRPVPRTILGGLSILMLVGGLLLFSWPFLTNLWTDYKQAGLEDQFRSPSHRRAYVTRTIRPGEALTRIRIPQLGVDTIVVEGTTLSALQAGAGHYARTALPCEQGNSAIAGHRTTYGKPFAEIDELEAGDRITLETPVGRCTYKVVGSPYYTHPEDFGVLDPVRGTLLTLTTCHPPGSADQRLIVHAKLVSSEVFPASS